MCRSVHWASDRKKPSLGRALHYKGVVGKAMRYGFSVLPLPVTILSMCFKIWEYDPHRCGALRNVLTKAGYERHGSV